MTNTITLTENENTFLEMIRIADESDKEFIFKSLLCAVKFGEEFFDDIKEHIKRKDRNAILSVVERYISRLEREEQK